MVERVERKKHEFLSLANFFLYVSWFLLALAGIRIFYFLAAYGDIYPHWDEWDFVPAKGNVIQYLFSFSNENMQFFTNAQFLLVQYLGLPFKANVFISYSIYLWLLWEFYLYLKQFVEPKYRWMLILSFLPLFSDYMLDNLFWPLLSQSWFYFLFMIMAVKFGFMYPQDNRYRFLTAVMIVLSVLAMNVSFIILFTVLYLGKNIYIAQTAKERKSECLFAAVWLVAMVILLILFFIGMKHHDQTVIDWKALFSGAFYQRLAYFIISPITGLLIKPEQYVWYGLLCAVFLIWLLILFYRQLKDKSGYGLWAIILILGGSLAAVTLFRGQDVFGLKDYAGRYLPYSLFLIPAVCCVGRMGINKYMRRISFGLSAVILVVATVGLFDGRHWKTIDRIENGRKCVEIYYQAPKRPNFYYCSNKYPRNLVPYLENFEAVFIK